MNSTTEYECTSLAKRHTRRFIGGGALVAAAITSAALSPCVSAETTSILWRFKGADGLKAPEQILDDSGQYALVRNQFGSSSAITNQMSQSDSAGGALWWCTNGTIASSSDAAGSVQMYRWEYANSAPTKRHSASYVLGDDAAVKTLFPTNASGDLLPFTLEMYFKVAPYASSSNTMYNMRKNFYLATLSRESGNYQYNTVFKINGLSRGQISLQGESYRGANGDVVTLSCAEESDFRDGLWHHIALVYSLNENVTPHQGTVEFYLDHALKQTETMTRHSTVRSFKYAETSNAGGMNATFTIGEIQDWGPDLCIDEVRLSNSALGPESFMHAVWSESLKERDSGTIARWTFDSPGERDDEVGVSKSSVASSDGQTTFGLQGATYNGSVKWDTAWNPNGDFQPIFTNDVPHAIVWDPGVGIVVNADNATSIFFKHMSENGATIQTNIGSSAHSQRFALSQFDAACSNFTLECFVKSDKTFANNVSGVFGLFYPPGNSDKYAVLDMRYGKYPRTCYKAAGNSYQELNSNTAVNDGEWHHIAANFDVSSGTSTVVKLWLDYERGFWTQEKQGAIFWNPRHFGVIFGAMMQDKALSGMIDEPRVSAGDIGVGRFLRAFNQREDMTGVWLVPTNSALTGAEWHSPDTAWLAGRWEEGAIAASDVLPAEETVISVGGRTVSVRKSASFNGTGGLTIPCAAIVGTNVFTVEANVCGKGRVFTKKRYGNVASWGMGVTDDGAYVDVDGTRTLSDAQVADGRWHHLAIVINMTEDNSAVLYVDGVQSAVADVSGMTLDSGDLLVGEDFTGNFVGVRFSPGIVVPEKFMRTTVPKGLIVSFR